MRCRSNLRALYDVDESASRFATYFHVLREVVHLACGRLALEPQIQVKYALADHLYDDARAVTKIRRRLVELGAPADPPPGPGPELATLLDRAGGPAFADEVYGAIKPRLIDAFRLHLDGIDPLADEPSLRLLTQLLHRQERHVVELPASVPHPDAGGPDLGSLPLRPGEVRELRVTDPVGEPARDAYLTVTPGDDDAARPPLDGIPLDPEEQRRFVHRQLHDALCAAELTARTSHEHPEMPWDFHVDLARRCWDEIRAAEVHDRLLAAELGGRWGEYPVDFALFRARYAEDLAGRLAPPAPPAAWRHSERRRELVEQGQERLARAFDHLDADRIAHVQDAGRWGTHLLGGEAAAAAPTVP